MEARKIIWYLTERKIDLIEEPNQIEALAWKWWIQLNRWSREFVSETALMTLFQNSKSPECAFVESIVNDSES